MSLLFGDALKLRVSVLVRWFLHVCAAGQPMLLSQWSCHAHEQFVLHIGTSLPLGLYRLRACSLPLAHHRMDLCAVVLPPFEWHDAVTTSVESTVSAVEYMQEFLDHHLGSVGRNCLAFCSPHRSGFIRVSCRVVPLLGLLFRFVKNCFILLRSVPSPCVGPHVLQP